MKQAPKFFVTIPVKPYVRRFLEMNYGFPISFSDDPDAHRFLQELLSKPNNIYDKKYPEQMCTYKEVIDVVISEHDFYKYGFELTRTDVVTFGKRYEDRAKTLMRNVVGVYHSIGLPLKDSILKFQRRFNFDEDVWSFQTISKDFYRNGTIDIVDFDNEIFRKVEKIILLNLYNLRTISKKVINEYENNY